MDEQVKKVWHRFVIGAMDAIDASSRVIPLPVLLGLGRELGLLGYRFSKRYRDVAMKNLGIAFGDLLSPAEKQEIIRQVFINFGKTTIEFPVAANLSDARVRSLVQLDPDDKVALDRLHDSGKPFIAVSAHFGNFELMARRLALEGYKFVVIVRNDNNAVMADAMNRVRKQSGYEVIGRGEAASALLRRMRHEEHLCVVMLPDQKSDEVFVPFFGKVTGTVAGPAVIGLRTGAPIQPIFCVRNPDDTHKIVLSRLIEMSAPGARRKSIEAVMCEINDAIEAIVRRYPEQWLWLHDRWRVDPPDGYVSRDAAAQALAS